MTEEQERADLTNEKPEKHNLGEVSNTDVTKALEDLNACWFMPDSCIGWTVDHKKAWDFLKYNTATLRKLLMNYLEVQDSSDNTEALEALERIIESSYSDGDILIEGWISEEHLNTIRQALQGGVCNNCTKLDAEIEKRDCLVDEKIKLQEENRNLLAALNNQTIKLNDLQNQQAQCVDVDSLKKYTDLRYAKDEQAYANGWNQAIDSLHKQGYLRTFVVETDGFGGE